jgi:hypothetical protein
MKILLDECVDWRLMRDLEDHEVRTVKQAGWELLPALRAALLVPRQGEFQIIQWRDSTQGSSA